MPELLRVEGLKKSFPRGRKELKAVDNVSFTLRAGETQGRDPLPHRSAAGLPFLVPLPRGRTRMQSGRARAHGDIARPPGGLPSLLRCFEKQGL